MLFKSLFITLIAVIPYSISAGDYQLKVEVKKQRKSLIEHGYETEISNVIMESIVTEDKPFSIRFQIDELEYLASGELKIDARDKFFISIKLANIKLETLKNVGKIEHGLKAQTSIIGQNNKSYLICKSVWSLEDNQHFAENRCALDITKGTEITEMFITIDDELHTAIH